LKACFCLLSSLKKGAIKFRFPDTDPGQTLYHKSIWDRLRQKITALGRQAERFLATGELSLALKTLLDSQVRLILAHDPERVGLSVLFSRGCAWRKCRFCAHNFSFGGRRHDAGSQEILIRR
jgi:radical SAM superfamily enzyme YgiQ (UPF0313 family)